MNEPLAQLAIAFLTIPGIWMVGSTDRRTRRLGYTLNFIAQPAWLYSTWRAEQWGMLLVAAILTAAWAYAIWTHRVPR